MTPPTKTEIAAAFSAGADVRAGVVIHVPLADGYAVPNLAQVVRGRTVWHTVHHLAPGVIDLRDEGDRTIYVGDMAVGPEDMRHVLAACAACPSVASRHDAGADVARLKAGGHAMKCMDNMLRARLLDAVDGWVALEASGTVISRDPEHGTLVAPPDHLLITCYILIVVCPSTGRRYAMRVPADMRTAALARAWVMLGKTPEVET